ncbi:MAG TPA: MauE/DoxX family redox-associated membrane protein [Candidatus Babeliaceae bacterium]|nr:MauE/DoxX family redox-associated membrane protein [Candidatus Babeliaceae bacterium]
MREKTTIRIISILLIILFVYASVSKLLDYQRFVVQLGKSPLIGTLSPFIAVVIPTVEIAIAISLLYQRTQLLGLFGSLFLMVLFTTYLVVMLNFSPYIPCSCGGILQGMSWKTHIVFNLCFLLLSAIAVLLKSADKPIKITMT